MRHAEAYQYLRLTWKPRKFDRVRFQGRKFRVARVSKSKGIKLSGRNGWLYAGETLWRPTPSDFNAVLDKLSELWVYRQLLPDNRQIVGVRCNGRIVTIKGRPRQVLSQVLSLRVLEPNVSVMINRFFEQAYDKKGSAENVIRIHTASSKAGSSS